MNGSRLPNRLVNFGAPMIKAISKTSIHFGLSTHALSGVMRTTDNFVVDRDPQIYPINK